MKFSFRVDGFRLAYDRVGSSNQFASAIKMRLSS